MTSKATSSNSKSGGELVFVIAGKDQALVDVQCRRLIHTLVPQDQRDTALLDADPTEPAQDIFDELRTLPFLASQRVVLIRKADEFITKNRPLLERYFDHPSRTGILVLVVSTWQSNTKLAKKLPAVGKLIRVEPPKPAQLPTHLVQYARQSHQKNLAPAAARVLIELLGPDAARCQGEIDKLALFAADQDAISAEHVNQLIGRDRFFNAFEVIDAVTAGRADHAIERMRAMFAHDRSSEYTFIGAFAWHFRKLFTAKTMQQNGASGREIASTLRIWANKNGFFNQLRLLSLERIGIIIAQLGQMDYQIKTGRTTPQLAAERFVLSLQR